MTKAVIYARYSSDIQRGESIAAQVRACAEYAATKGMTITGQYVDEAVSGKGSQTAQRRQYQKMLRDSSRGLFSVVLVHKYDRLARSLAEHVTLEKKLHDKGVQLVAVAQDFGNTPESKIVKTLMWSLSEYFLFNLAGEVRKGHKETAIAGKHNGGMGPFGYRIVDQKYIIDPLEAEYVRRMFDAAQSGTGFRALIEEMAARGIRGRYGKPIKYTQIYEILHNEKYFGTYVYSPEKEKTRADQRTKPNAIRVPGAVPAIIAEAQYREVQKIMEQRKHAGRKANYLCSGLIYCSCGAKMHAIKSGGKYPYFYCSQKCGAPNVKMEAVDDAAVKYLKELLSPVNQEDIASAIRLYQSNEGNRLQAFFGALKKRVAEKRKQYNALMDNLKAGALPAAVLAEIGAEMEALKAEIDALENAQPPEDFTTDTIKAWLESIKAAPDENAVRLLIERIEVNEKTDFNIFSTLKSVLGNNGAPIYTKLEQC